jgi:hypothetical protein
VHETARVCLTTSVDAWLGLLGSLVLAVLAFLFGRVNLNRQNAVQRDEDLRRARLDTYSALCETIVEYRRAQLHRWFVGRDVGAADEVERQRPEVADEVRRTRAAAWGQFYRVVMICNDDELERRARVAMSLTKQMKDAASSGELNALSNRVHRAVDDLARQAGLTIRSPQQRSPAPPPDWSSGNSPVTSEDGADDEHV